MARCRVDSLVVGLPLEAQIGGNRVREGGLLFSESKFLISVDSAGQHHKTKVRRQFESRRDQEKFERCGAVRCRNDVLWSYKERPTHLQCRKDRDSLFPEFTCDLIRNDMIFLDPRPFMIIMYTNIQPT